MSGNPNSTLAKNTKYHLNISVDKEACPLQLAPTSSTTATLVMGDAIAVALMKLRDFKDVNFAKFHPGGSLGRRLLTKVEDVMKKVRLPICNGSLPIIDVVHKITEGKCGLVVVLRDNKILGVISDGDIRRTMQSNENGFFDLVAKDVMTRAPKTINGLEKLVQAEEIMRKRKINSLLVSNESDNLVGIIQLYDLI